MAGRILASAPTRDNRRAVVPGPREPCGRVDPVTRSEPAVEVRELEKTFRTGWPRRRRQVALRGVSFAVRAGTIFAVLGPNGAGKTTLLSILGTLLLPDRGEAR
ncbi:MAG: ATP-binding cassette domain-containing protein, partial [Candidatus Rokubacteria bacterium]|nr:ATP-binding cassette domain-containing protein [Candidatus Rokubacteria bacterium]